MHVHSYDYYSITLSLFLLPPFIHWILRILLELQKVISYDHNIIIHLKIILLSCVVWSS